MIGKAGVGLIFFAAMLGASSPAIAQDGVYDPMIQGATDQQVALGLNRIHAHRLRQSYNRNPSRRGNTNAQALSSHEAATCANKGRAAANFGRSHPKVRRLYELCARAGH